jgi:hypothetical protein
MTEFDDPARHLKNPRDAAFRAAFGKMEPVRSKIHP